jgi:hypothetical protein
MLIYCYYLLYLWIRISNSAVLLLSLNRDVLYFLNLFQIILDPVERSDNVARNVRMKELEILMKAIRKARLQIRQNNFILMH